MSSINLTFNIESGFEDDSINSILGKNKFNSSEPTNEHQKWVRKGLDLVVTRYKQKIVIQGKYQEKSLNFIREISKLDYLTNDFRNAEKLAKLFKISHNTLFCMNCKATSMIIKGELNGLDLVFNMECGHKNDMNPPIFMLTSRIIPDINILVNGHLSRCIDLGFFTGFEIVICKFAMEIMDNLGDSKKAGASKEIYRLKELEKENKITIFSCVDNKKIPSKEDFDRMEDNIILEIANLTNSILLTGDMNLKDKAFLDKRPTIYIHPKDAKKIKQIHETRKA